MVENNQNIVDARTINPSEDNIKYAAKRLTDGFLVSFATETVYGLGANCFNKEAVLNIFRYKGRPLSDPLILHIHSIDQIYPLVELDDNTKELLKILSKSFWPGQLTIILKANKEKISNYITAGTDYVSFRIPNHKDALSLLREVNFPVAAPSANKFCHVSPVTAEHVFKDFKEFDIDIIDSGKCEFSMESTVIKPDAENKKLIIYRKGSLTKEDFVNILPLFTVEYFVKPQPHNIVIDLAEDIKETQECPGQFIKHYSPLIPAFILSSSSNDNDKNYQKLDKDTIEKAVIIDYNGTISDKIKHNPIKVFELSKEGKSEEALRNLYDYLRKAEEIENASYCLLPDFKELLSDNDKYKLILIDRVEKASSGMKVKY